MNSFSPKIVFQLQVLMFCWASIMASRSNVTTCSSCYGFYNQNKTRIESETKCRVAGGHLVTMETVEEWTFIKSEIQNRSTYKDEWYIGLKNKTDAWQWINNKSLTFNDKWQPNEPSGDGKCVVMAKNYPDSSRGLWNDLPCATTRGFICEYDKGSEECNSVKTFPFNCSGQKMKPTVSTVPTTACSLTDSDQFNLVYVVIALGILLAGGIGFYIYIFYCKNRNTGFPLGCKKYETCKIKTRTSLQMEEGAMPLQAREPTTDTVIEDDINKTETTSMPIIKTEIENSAEPQDPAQDTVEDSATQDYTIPTDPSSTSTYAALYSTVDIKQKKPEENEDNTPPKIPSPYHKASGEPVVYATVDKSKKTKGRDSHVQVVYATVDKKRKNNKDDTC